MTSLSTYIRDVWEWFDLLSDVKKVAIGSMAALFLFSSWLYCLGFVGLATMNQEAIAAPATVSPTITPTAAPTVRATAATSPAPTVSLPANLPTERPLATAVLTSRPAPPPSQPTIAPSVTSGGRLPTSTPIYTPSPGRATAVTGTVGPVSPSPTTPFRVTPGLPNAATPTYATPTPSAPMPTVSQPTATVPAASTAIPTRVPFAPSPTAGGR